MLLQGFPLIGDALGDLAQSHKRNHKGQNSCKQRCTSILWSALVKNSKLAGERQERGTALFFLCFLCDKWLTPSTDRCAIACWNELLSMTISCSLRCLDGCMLLYVRWSSSFSLFRANSHPSAAALGLRTSRLNTLAAYRWTISSSRLPCGCACSAGNRTERRGRCQSAQLTREACNSSLEEAQFDPGRVLPPRAKSSLRFGSKRDPLL